MKNRILILSSGVLALLMLVMFSKSVLAQEPTPSADRINALAREMYCPVCENTPLDVCPTQACAQWRDLIKQKMELGWSDKQIKDYFVAQYGDRVLAQPPAHGLNLMVYILPPLFILMGVFVLVRSLRKMRTSSANKILENIKSTRLESDDPYRSRIEEELDQYDKS